MTEVVELQARRGSKYDETGEVIASHEGSIVFLPQGILPNYKVRVVLEPIKADSRGKMMYRGVPAPSKTTTKWKDNRDGTIILVIISVDWLGKTSESDGDEIRVLQKRDGVPSTKSSFQAVWGSDQATSYVEERSIRVVPLEEEKVEDGQIVWQKTGERDEPLLTISYPVIKIGDINEQVAYQGLEEIRWEDWTFETKPKVSYMKDGQEQSLTHVSKWVDLPVFVQAHLQKDWPICGCGRARVCTVDRSGIKWDGYPRCSQCRAEESCARCGQQKPVSQQPDGLLICSDCKPLEDMEQLAKQVLGPEGLTTHAELANLLLSGQAVEGKAGEIILMGWTDHVSESDGWNNPRKQVLDRMLGYAWYYFTPQGVYGSKLPVVALKILQYLDQAEGNALVELVAWLSKEQHSVQLDSDYFIKTQVKGEQIKIQLTESVLREVVVAVKLRGTEDDRQRALVGIQLLEAAGLTDQAAEIKQILSAPEQDYAAAAGQADMYQQFFLDWQHRKK